MDTVYVALLNEGIDVWRPVEAMKIDNMTFQLIGPVGGKRYNPEDEDWAFTPGTVVICEYRTFQDGVRGLVAIAKVSA